MTDRTHDDLHREIEQLQNVIAALKVAIRVTHSISEERLQEMIAIARGEEVER